MKKLFLISICLFTTSVFAVSHPPLKDNSTLGVCSYSEFKPISYGNGEGYEADLLKQVAKNWNVKIKFYPEKIYESLWLKPSDKNSPCDVAIGGFTPAPYRIKEGAVFSDKTLTFQQSLLVRKKDFQSGRIVSYDSFKNTEMKIGVVPGTTGESYAQQRAMDAKLPKTTLVQMDDESKLLPALKSGEIDAIARGEIGNEYQACLDSNFVTIAKKDFGEGFTIAIDANNKTLQKDLNQAIHHVLKTKEFQKRKYQLLNNPCANG